MRTINSALAAVTLMLAVHSSTQADDAVVVQSMRIEGTIPKTDNPIFDINPYRKDRMPYCCINSQFGGSDELAVSVVKDKTQAVVYLGFGGDKKLKEQASKLIGKRAVVECKGEFNFYKYKKKVFDRNAWAEQEVVEYKLSLTVLKLEEAK